MSPHYFTIHHGIGANPGDAGQEMAGPDESGGLILTVAFEETVDVRPLDPAR